MGIWASLFSSPSVIKKAADGIYNGVDAAIYTDQEKANGFMGMLSEATYIDLTMLETVEGINTLELAGLLDEGRADEILNTPTTEGEVWNGAY